MTGLRLLNGSTKNHGAWEHALDREIEIFRKEEEEAQQHLFAFLGVRALLAERPDALAMVNRHSM
jgi:hypothetical protein